MTSIDKIKSWPWVSTAAALGGAAVMAPRFAEVLAAVPGYDAVVGAAAFAAPVLSIGAGVAGLRNAFDKQRSGLSRIFSAVAGVTGLAPVAAMPFFIDAPHGMGIGTGMVASIMTMTVAGSLNVAVHTFDSKKNPAQPAGKTWWVGPAVLAAAFGGAALMSKQVDDDLTRGLARNTIFNAGYDQSLQIKAGDDMIIVSREADAEYGPASITTYDFGPKAQICIETTGKDGGVDKSCAALSGFSEDEMADVRYASCALAKRKDNAVFISRHCP